MFISRGTTKLVGLLMRIVTENSSPTTAAAGHWRSVTRKVLRSLFAEIFRAVSSPANQTIRIKAHNGYWKITL